LDIYALALPDALPIFQVDLPGGLAVVEEVVLVVDADAERGIGGRADPDDLGAQVAQHHAGERHGADRVEFDYLESGQGCAGVALDRKSTRLNSSHAQI